MNPHWIEELNNLIDDYKEIAKIGDVINKIECLHFICKILVKIFHISHNMTYLDIAKEQINIINTIMPLDYSYKNKIITTDRLITNYYVE